MPRIAPIAAAAARAALCAVTLPALAGCYLDGSVVGTPRTVVERALAFCGEKTEAAETACIRKALSDGRVSVAALAATIPGCRVGAACSVQYRTRDRQGLLAATSSDYVADWRVTFDLKAAVGTAPAVGLPVVVQLI